jgi:hypothetical protein
MTSLRVLTWCYSGRFGAVGTAIAAALLIGVPSVRITRDLVDNPVIPKDLKAQVDLDEIPFISNDRLLEVLEETTAVPEQVTEALRSNTEGRSRALRIGFVATTQHRRSPMAIGLEGGVVLA